MNEEKLYIGCKVIRASKMTQFEFISRIKNQDIEQNQIDQEGYLVIYEDGYKSWSPKEVFERCYRELMGREFDLVTNNK